MTRMCFFFVLCCLMLASASTHPDNNMKTVAEFLQSNLKIEVEKVDKFQMRQIPNSQKLDIRIENGRKSVKLILLFDKNVQNYVVVFMEEVARFGTQKSFLNIRTSRGVDEEPSTEEKSQKSGKQGEAADISQNRKQAQFKQAPKMPTFENIFLRKIKQYIVDSLPLAVPNSIKFVDLTVQNQYKVEIKIGKQDFTLRVLKYFEGGEEKLKIQDITKVLAKKQ